jgi:hypothetical protein
MNEVSTEVYKAHQRESKELHPIHISFQRSFDNLEAWHLEGYRIRGQFQGALQSEQFYQHFA